MDLYLKPSFMENLKRKRHGEILWSLVLRRSWQERGMGNGEILWNKKCQVSTPYGLNGSFLFYFLKVTGHSIGPKMPLLMGAFVEFPIYINKLIDRYSSADDWYYLFLFATLFFKRYACIASLLVVCTGVIVCGSSIFSFSSPSSLKPCPFKRWRWVLDRDRLLISSSVTETGEGYIFYCMLEWAWPFPSSLSRSSLSSWSGSIIVVESLSFSFLLIGVQGYPSTI